MLSKYFQMKTSTKKFDDDLLWSIGEIKDKKVIIYGAGEGFVELNKKYKFNKNLNIVAIADKKFECSCGHPCSCKKEFEGFKAIEPTQILNEDYDVILISNEYAKPIVNYLEIDLGIQNKDIRTMFNFEVKDENTNYNYLEEYKFGKHLEKINKKLKNKSIIIYGAGAFFELINMYYDLSKLNIIGVSDKRFEKHDENEEFLGYKVYAPNEIENVKPDYVLVATKSFITIIENLYYETLKGSKIKIKPLMKKPFMILLKEIWN